MAAELKFDTTRALLPEEPLAAPVATPILATPASPVAPTMPSKVAARPVPPVAATVKPTLAAGKPPVAPLATPMTGATPPVEKPKRPESEVHLDMQPADLGSQSGDLIPLLELETPAQPASGAAPGQAEAELKFDTTRALLPDEPVAAPVATPILATLVGDTTGPEALLAEVPPQDGAMEAEPLLVPLADQAVAPGPQEAVPVAAPMGELAAESEPFEGALSPPEPTPIPDAAGNEPWEAAVSPPAPVPMPDTTVKEPFGAAASPPEPAPMLEPLAEPVLENALEGPVLAEAESDIRLEDIQAGIPAAPPSNVALEAWSEPAPVDSTPPARPLTPGPVIPEVADNVSPDFVEEIAVADAGSGVGMAEPMAEVAAEPVAGEDLAMTAEEFVPPVPDEPAAAGQVVHEAVADDLSEEIVVAESASGVNLAEAFPDAGDSPSSAVAVQAWEGGSPPAPASPIPIPEVPEDASGMDFLEAVDFGAQGAAGSSKQIVAEPALPEETDLGETPPLPSDSEEIYAEAMVEPETPAPVSGTVAIEAVETAEAEMDIAALAEAEGPSDVDLDAIEAVEEGPSGIDLTKPRKSKAAKPVPELPALPELPEEETWAGASDEAIALEEPSEELAPIEEEEGEYAAIEEEEECEVAVKAPPRRKTVPPPKKPKYGRRWFAGILLGFLFGGVVVTGLWAYGMLNEDWKQLIPEHWRQTIGMNAPPKRDNPPGSHQTIDEKSPPGATELQNALANLSNGEFPKALDVLAKPSKDPKWLAARGEALWVNYLKLCGKERATQSMKISVSRMRSRTWGKQRH